MKALLIVDIQNDFCPGGALAVTDGNAVIKPSNRLIEAFEQSGLPVILTRDWHPAAHSSFRENGGIWPPHCIAGTPGADFHEDLIIPDDAHIISKASAVETDAYSGFEGTELNALLKKTDTNEVIIAGLATDYCVKNTVLDALRLGYRTIVAAECIRAVNVNPGDGRAAVNEMVAAGAVIESVEKLIT